MTIILCDNFEQADAASRALYRLGVPQALRDAGDYGTTLALEIIRHPTSGDYGLRCLPGSLGYNIHPLLVDNSNLIVWSDELTPFVDDPTITTENVRNFANEHKVSETPAIVTGEWILSQVSSNRKLSPGDEGYDDWFPVYEEGVI